MATEFTLDHVSKKDLYVNQSRADKEKLRYEMVQMALVKGNKPAARYYKTYPSTVRRWVKRYQEYGDDGLRDHIKRTNSKY